MASGPAEEKGLEPEMEELDLEMETEFGPGSEKDEWLDGFSAWLSGYDGELPAGYGEPPGPGNFCGSLPGFQTSRIFSLRKTC